MMNRINNVWKILILVILSMICLLICPFFGIRNLTINDLLNAEELKHIFLMIRVPRVLGAFIAGGGLAVAGMIYQALFRNPLASPYTLGVSGGASLGAALSIAFGGFSSVIGFSSVSIASFGGAVCAVMLVYAFSWSKEANSTTLLLAGVIVATVCSGMIMMINYITPLRHSFQIMRWIMGGVDGVSYSFFLAMLFPVLLFYCLVTMFAPQLDQFLTGDALAHSRGINIKKSRTFFIVLSALAVGIIVSVCGPIGFVGIIAPHSCRILLPGIRHRLLAMVSFMFGGSFLVLSDTLARTISPPAEIPVGIITALFGGPFFLYILYRRGGCIQI